MTNSGVRILIVDTKCTLRYSEERIVIEQDKTIKEVPIFEVQLVVIHSLQVHITSMLISMLYSHNIKVVFCGCKGSPVMELQNAPCQNLSTARIYEQIEWTETDKSSSWQKIVQAKIKNQAKVLEYVKGMDAECMRAYYTEVLPGDSTNREAAAAHYYFKALFGTSFSRDRENNINSALNYGYAILLSAINRSLSVHGYNTCLGIRHGSKTNPYNLSYDLIEIFRPIVDVYVYKHRERELDAAYKKELISILHQKIRYDGKKQLLSNVIDIFVSDILGNMQNEKYAVKEMMFIE